MINNLLEQAIEVGNATFLINKFGAIKATVGCVFNDLDGGITAVMCAEPGVPELILQLVGGSEVTNSEICDLISELVEGTNVSITYITCNSYILGVQSTNYLVTMDRQTGELDELRPLKKQA